MSVTVIRHQVALPSFPLSASYLQACGANRRTAGVVSDIKRPGGDVCAAARADTMKRMGAAHPDHAA